MEEIKNAMVEVNTETQEVNTEREGVSEAVSYTHLTLPTNSRV